MRRVGRIIYNGAVALSLLLGLLTVGVWVRSYWVSERFGWEYWPPDQSFLDNKGFWVSRGGVQWTAFRLDDLQALSLGKSHFYQSRRRAVRYPFFADQVEMLQWSIPRRYAALGFEVIPQAIQRFQRNNKPATPARSLTLPLYFPCLLFALLPAHYFLRVRRRRRMAARRARGCCVFCGYDLRASAGRCPECGREASQGRAANATTH